MSNPISSFYKTCIFDDPYLQVAIVGMIHGVWGWGIGVWMLLLGELVQSRLRLKTFQLRSATNPSGKG